jgi:hypothetical protein
MSSARVFGNHWSQLTLGCILVPFPSEIQRYYCQYSPDFDIEIQQGITQCPKESNPAIKDF